MQLGARKPIPKAPAKPAPAAKARAAPKGQAKKQARKVPNSGAPAPASAAAVLAKRRAAGSDAGDAGTAADAGAPGDTPVAADDESAEKEKAVRKRAKASDVNPEEAEVALRTAQAQGSFAKVGLAEIKAFLKWKGKPVGGKKAELVERAIALLV